MKSSQPKAKTVQYGKMKSNDEGGKFVDRDLTKVNPKTEQFAPTDAEPVRQRFKMGGGC